MSVAETYFYRDIPRGVIFAITGARKFPLLRVDGTGYLPTDELRNYCAPHIRPGTRWESMQAAERGMTAALHARAGLPIPKQGGSSATGCLVAIATAAAMIAVIVGGGA